MRCCRAKRVKTIHKGMFGQLSKILDTCNTVPGLAAGFFPFMHFFDRWIVAGFERALRGVCQTPLGAGICLFATLLAYPWAISFA